MFIFLYGEDTYRSRQKLSEIIEEYQEIHKSGLNLKYFDGKTLNPSDIRDELQQVSMFEEKKLIVLRDIFSAAKNEEKVLETLKSLKNSKDIIVVCQEDKTAKSSPLFKFLKKYGKCQEFSFLETEELKGWLKKEFAKHNAEIDPQALNQLINFAGNNLWQQANEIKKLVNFKAGKKIELKDIELLVKPAIETDIFKTIDALARKNKRQALFLLHKHLEKGDNPFYLLSMINFQFRNLLIVKNLIEKNVPYYSIAKRSNLHPYTVKKSYEQADKFSFQELKKIYRKIFEVDLNIKTGKLAAEAGLDLLITGI